MAHESLRGHATNSYGFTSSQAKFWFLMYHLQLEILTLRLNVAFLAESMVNPHILNLVSQFWFYTF